MNSFDSPVVLEGRLDSGISRALWLVKWLLLIPHYVILLVLWIALAVLTVIAWFAILFTGRLLVKSWLLAIPHLMILAFFLGSGLYATQGTDAIAWSWGSGIVGLLVLFAGVVMLFGRRYPQGIFDLVLGIDRWAVRVAAYVCLMTDSYPPFRLDQGGSDPAGQIAPEPSMPSGEAATPPPEPSPAGAGQL